MKCFGAKGQLSSSLFADGTAARSLHQAAGCTVGFHREARLCPASNKQPIVNPGPILTATIFCSRR